MYDGINIGKQISTATRYITVVYISGYNSHSQSMYVVFDCVQDGQTWCLNVGLGLVIWCPGNLYLEIFMMFYYLHGFDSNLVNF